ncbi:MAG: helix-turn-helix domain-containing protein [Deltaproteobacteria bacterium]|nr:helix-turn-helix domain-containing protein [Deltaproteobacteria bacterium]
MVQPVKHEALLTTVGARVRALREERGYSRRVLSERCGVSERFLAQLESGQGNISLARFADVALALGTSPAALLAGSSQPQARAIALLGVRGAGKSTVGQALADRRGVDFVELDREIEHAAGISLAQIFELHGESYYRRVERQVLAALLATDRAMVLATGGSIVTDPESYELLRSRARTIWLKARPEDHWNRVVEQGDQRPMAENPHAFAELKALLSAREPLYARADHVVDTADHAPRAVVEAISDALQTDAAP